MAPFFDMLIERVDILVFGPFVFDLPAANPCAQMRLELMLDPPETDKTIACQ